MTVKMLIQELEKVHPDKEVSVANLTTGDAYELERVDDWGSTIILQVDLPVE